MPWRRTEGWRYGSTIIDLGTRWRWEVRTWSEPQELSVRRGGVSAEIRSEHRPNTGLERYRYHNLPIEAKKNKEVKGELVFMRKDKARLCGCLATLKKVLVTA
jgi:hypothetical protein